MSAQGLRKYRRSRWLHKLLNVGTKLRLGRTKTLRYALLETTGRRSGAPRQTPVSYHVDGSTVWVVAIHGEQADYVKNLRHDPNVRVKIGGVWRDGTAEVQERDDVSARTRMWNRTDRAFGRLLGSSLLTIKVTLT
jgi:deazaflavin-dependent oxidoreductase (nitroreductase family)